MVPVVRVPIANYFRYTEHATRYERDLYSKYDWEEMLIANLQEGFPLYYSGADGNEGHAFVCCGYRESDRKFYFNWGWSGYNNNYFAIDALNTYSGSFNEYQSAIADMIPDYVLLSPTLMWLLRMPIQRRVSSLGPILRLLLTAVL